jgi:hypothetical protein
MRRFLAKILLFSFPLLVALYPLDLFFSHLLRQSNAYRGEFEVMNDILDGDAACDIAIYGSSRAWVHFHPGILHDSMKMTVYNFGIDGHNFWLQYMRHVEFLKYNPQPKIIILSVDIYTLQKRKDLYQMEQFLPYMLWNRNVYEYTRSYEGYTTADYFIPLLRYSGKASPMKMVLTELFRPGISPPYRYRGYVGMDKPWGSDLERAMELSDAYHVDVDSASVTLLEAFVRECQRRKIRLIFVYAPEYIEGQEYVENRSEVMHLFHRMALRHAVPFLDYSDSDFSKRRDLFYNSGHLNKQGSQLFSARLASDVKDVLQR